MLSLYDFLFPILAFLHSSLYSYLFPTLRQQLVLIEQILLRKTCFMFSIAKTDEK